MSLVQVLSVFQLVAMGRSLTFLGFSFHICMVRDSNGALGSHVLPALKFFRVALAFLPILSLLLSA